MKIVNFCDLYTEVQGFTLYTEHKISDNCDSVLY